MSGDPVELVRRSARAVAAEGTARLWWRVRWYDDEEDEWSDLFEGGGREGRVEFGRLRYEIPGEVAGEGGHHYVRMPPRSGWEAWGAPGRPVDARSPFWLIALVGGATRAEELGAEHELTGYACSFDLVAADRASEYALMTVGALSVRETQAIPGEAWLDAAGRLRRASCRLPATDMELRLDDLGGPEPIELPANAGQA